MEIDYKMTNNQAIEMLRNPKKYMYVYEGEIELEGWLQEAIRMAIKALQQVHE